MCVANTAFSEPDPDALVDMSELVDEVCALRSVCHVCVFCGANVSRLVVPCPLALFFPRLEIHSSPCVQIPGF